MPRKTPLHRGENAALFFGRLLLAALLLPSGIDKLLHFSRFAASHGVPMTSADEALFTSRSSGHTRFA